MGQPRYVVEALDLCKAPASCTQWQKRRLQGSLLPATHAQLQLHCRCSLRDEESAEQEKGVHPKPDIQPRKRPRHLHLNGDVRESAGMRSRISNSERLGVSCGSDNEPLHSEASTSGSDLAGWEQTWQRLAVSRTLSRKLWKGCYHLFHSMQPQVRKPAVVKVDKAGQLPVVDHMPLKSSSFQNRKSVDPFESKPQDGIDLGTIWGLLVLGVAYVHHSTTGYGKPLLNLCWQYATWSVQHSWNEGWCMFKVRLAGSSTIHQPRPSTHRQPGRAAHHGIHGAMHMLPLFSPTD